MAVVQLWLAGQHALSAWCGGGFGMFSTTDGWGARHLHAVAVGPAFRSHLAVPTELAPAVERALALPTETNLRALARALAPTVATDLETPESIRIDVFVRTHDPLTLAPEGRILRSFELTLPKAP